MPDQLKMGLLGCGGMSGAHMRGYQELWSKGIKSFDIVAACDIDANRAEERATQAHEFQGGQNRRSIQMLKRCLLSTQTSIVWTSVPSTAHTIPLLLPHWKRECT